MKVLITGASSGIGRQLALDYHQQGCEVWGVGRDQHRLKEVANRGIHSVAVDLADGPAVQQAFATLPKMNLIILCAGNCEYLNPQAFDAELFQRVWMANTQTVANCLQALWPQLQGAQLQGAQSQGSQQQLAIVGSLARLLPFTKAGAYGSSKAGLYYLSNSLRTDLKPRGVSVHYVDPGFVKTALTDKNDFSMPMLISPQQASVAIRTGLARGKKVIAFPSGFAWFLRALSWLPLGIQTRICCHWAKQA